MTREIAVVEPQVYIHIGPRKSGSTSIQIHLSRLDEPGFVYPRSARQLDKPDMRALNHCNVAYACLDEYRRRWFDPKCGGIDEVASEIRNSGCEKAVISSEALTDCDDSAIDELERAWPTAEVVICPREQVDLLASMWRYVKRKPPPGSKWHQKWPTFDVWALAHAAQWTWLNYYDVYLRWSERFVVHVLPFDRRRDIVEQFCKLVGLPPADVRTNTTEGTTDILDDTRDTIRSWFAEQNARLAAAIGRRSLWDG